MKMQVALGMTPKVKQASKCDEASACTKARRLIRSRNLLIEQTHGAQQAAVRSRNCRTWMRNAEPHENFTSMQRYSRRVDEGLRWRQATEAGQVYTNPSNLLC